MPFAPEIQIGSVVASDCGLKFQKPRDDTNNVVSFDKQH